MDVLHPTVMALGGIMSNVLLEENHVRVRDLNCVRGEKDWGGFVVDGIDDYGRSDCKRRQRRNTI